MWLSLDPTEAMRPPAFTATDWIQNVYSVPLVSPVKVCCVVPAWLSGMRPNAPLLLPALGFHTYWEAVAADSGVVGIVPRQRDLLIAAGCG